MSRKFFIGAAATLALGGGLLGALDKARSNLLQGNFTSIPGSTWSLIAFGSQNGSSGLTTTVTGLTTTTADMIVQCGSAQVGDTIVFTDSKNSSGIWVPFNGSLGTVRAQCAYTSTTPTVGTGHNFVGTSGLGFNPLIVFVFKGSSTATTPPLDQQHGLDGGTASTIQAGSITPGQANELVLAVDATDAGQPLSIDSGYLNNTIVSFVFGTSEGLGMAFLAQTTAAATNPTWTNSGTIPTVAVIASFKHS